MSTLRWILLILGIAVIAGIYLVGRRRHGGGTPQRLEPAFDVEATESAAAPALEEAAAIDADEERHEALDFDALIARGLENEVRRQTPKPKPASPPASPAADAAPPGASPSMLLEEELVVLHVMAPPGRGFEGPLLYDSLERAGFELRRGDIFYCLGREGEYMAINAVRPGTFPDEPDGFSTRAVGLILRLSKASRPLSAFDEFLMVADDLKGMLGGHLCDSNRSSLTPQTVTYLRDEVREYQVKHLKPKKQ